MKVQIEISKKVVSAATIALLEMAETERQQEIAKQAIERCRQEVTEVTLESLELGESEVLFGMALAMTAIRAKEIEEGEK